MIVLDHNIPRTEAHKLRQWRLRFEQVGFEVGRPEWLDQQELLRFLHSKKDRTFFTRDVGFFKARLRHRSYCIVVLTGPVSQTAATIRRFLRQHPFRLKGSRMGCVVKLLPTLIVFWRRNEPKQRRARWED